MLCSLSHLTTDQINAVKALEADLNLTVLAFSCHKAEPKALDKKTLEKIQAMEKKLGLSLVAVK